MTKYKEELNNEENKLFRLLSKIYANIKRDMLIELPAGGRVTWSDIQRFYRKITDDIVRSSVTTMYELSARRTVERNIKMPYFLTETDMAEIRRLSQKYQDWYWIGMEREIVKKTVTAFDPSTLLKLRNNNNNNNNNVNDTFTQNIELKDTFIGRMTDSIQSDVVSAAVVSKAMQIINPSKTDISNERIIQRNAAVYKNAANGDASMPHFTWVTAGDERVCEICGPLDGSMYTVGDPDTPRPVEDTHPRCRCELILEEAEEAVGEIEQGVPIGKKKGENNYVLWDFVTVNLLALDALKGYYRNPAWELEEEEFFFKF